MKNRGMAVSAVVHCARDGCLDPVLHGDIAKAKVPLLKATRAADYAETFP